MYDNKFIFMGATKSIGDYYDGFAHGITITLILISVILWIISDGIEQNKNFRLKIIFSISVFLLFWGIDELIFIFPFAASFSLIACILCFYSFFNLNTENRKM